MPNALRRSRSCSVTLSNAFWFPIDGRFFFANDVLETTSLGAFGVPDPNQL